jgi:hypothetical protein
VGSTTFAADILDIRISDTDRRGCGISIASSIGGEAVHASMATCAWGGSGAAGGDAGGGRHVARLGGLR